MEKKLKIKCVISSICVVIGIIVLALALKLENLSEVQSGFMTGFGTSFGLGSFILLVKNIIALRNPEKMRKREIEETDERKVTICTKSMAISFRLSMLLEAFLAIGLVCANLEYGAYLGWLIGVQLIIFLVSNVIISKKI